MISNYYLNNIQTHTFIFCEETAVLFDNMLIVTNIDNNHKEMLYKVILIKR